MCVTLPLFGFLGAIYAVYTTLLKFLFGCGKEGASVRGSIRPIMLWRFGLLGATCVLYTALSNLTRFIFHTRHSYTRCVQTTVALFSSTIAVRKKITVAVLSLNCVLTNNII